jgi:putative oxidoreductase
MKTFQELAAPVGRVLLALMFLLAGLNKISGYSGTQGFMESMGLPGALLPLVILLEVRAAYYSCWAGTPASRHS